MGTNLVRKIVNTNNQSWTAPPGVTQVRVMFFQKRYSQLSQWRQGLGISPDGTAFSWGRNSDGQLGNLSIADTSSPVAISGGKLFRAVATGFTHSLGIDESGDAYAWGLNDDGQLGDATIVKKSSPILVSGGRKWKQIDGGNNNSVGLTLDGLAFTWGTSSSGELGNGTTTPRVSAPVAVLGGRNYKQCFAATSNTCGAITHDGDLWMWGNNSNGECGGGISQSIVSSPILVVGGKKWIYAKTDSGFTIGVDEFGAVWGWGYGGTNIFPPGTNTSYSSPIAIWGAASNFATFNKKFAKAMPADSYSAVGLTESGEIYTWGSGSSGSLGRGSTANNNASTGSAILVMAGTKWIDVLSRGPSIVAMRDDGTLFGWGTATFGNFGSGTGAATQTTPTAVLGPQKFRSQDKVLISDQIQGVIPGVTYTPNIIARSLVANQINLNMVTGIGSPKEDSQVILEYFA